MKLIAGCRVGGKLRFQNQMYRPDFPQAGFFYRFFVSARFAIAIPTSVRYTDTAGPNVDEGSTYLTP